MISELAQRSQRAKERKTNDRGGSGFSSTSRLEFSFEFFYLLREYVAFVASASSLSLKSLETI